MTAYTYPCLLLLFRAKPPFCEPAPRTFDILRKSLLQMPCACESGFFPFRYCFSPVRLFCQFSAENTIRHFSRLCLSGVFSPARSIQRIFLWRKFQRRLRKFSKKMMRSQIRHPFRFGFFGLSLLSGQSRQRCFSSKPPSRGIVALASGRFPHPYLPCRQVPVIKHFRLLFLTFLPEIYFQERPCSIGALPAFLRNRARREPPG